MTYKCFICLLHQTSLYVSVSINSENSVPFNILHACVVIFSFGPFVPVYGLWPSWPCLVLSIVSSRTWIMSDIHSCPLTLPSCICEPAPLPFLFGLLLTCLCSPSPCSIFNAFSLSERLLRRPSLIYNHPLFLCLKMEIHSFPVSSMCHSLALHICLLPLSPLLAFALALHCPTFYLPCPFLLWTSSSGSVVGVVRCHALLCCSCSLYFYSCLVFSINVSLSLLCGGLLLAGQAFHLFISYFGFILLPFAAGFRSFPFGSFLSSCLLPCLCFALPSPLYHFHVLVVLISVPLVASLILAFIQSRLKWHFFLLCLLPAFCVWLLAAYTYSCVWHLSFFVAFFSHWPSLVTVVVQTHMARV